MTVSDGKRPRVLCLHGAGGGGWEWEAWSAVLRAAGYGVDAPDLKPAAGGLAATTLQDYRVQVERLADGVPVILVGASLGGWLALAASATVKPLARILVNPVPPAGTAGWPPVRRDYPDVVPWGSNPDFHATRRALPDGDFAAHLLAHRRWRDESGAVMRALNEGTRVENHSVPTLVLSGELDGDVPPSVAGELARDLGADFVRVRGASHLGPLLGDSAPGAAVLARDWLDFVLGFARVQE